MRILSFSFLKYCKHKTFRYHVSRQLSNNAVLVEADAAKNIGDPSLVQVSPTWPENEETSLRAAVMRDMRILPDFVSEAEEAAMLAELEPYLKRMRYEYDHWDNAIEGYRETERRQWSPANEAIIHRVKRAAFSSESETLPYAHVLDLAAAGHIKPHVDAVRFCGDTIAGLCLMSSAVMRLVHSEREHLQLDAMLQRRALYIMTGVSRYQFKHEVLGGDRSLWGGVRVPRLRRVAVICRSKPTHQH